MKTYTLTEFGRSIQCSKKVFGEEPFPPIDGEFLSPHMKALLDIIDLDFQRTKSEHFPDWEDSTYELKEGPLYSSSTIVRKDGEPVPEHIYNAWSAWYYWNEYDEGQPEEQPQFTYPGGYESKVYYYRQLAWYTRAPIEEKP